MPKTSAATSGLDLGDQIYSRLEAAVPAAVEKAVPEAVPAGLDDAVPAAIPRAVEEGVPIALPATDKPISDLAPEVRNLAEPVAQLQPLLEGSPPAGRSGPKA